MGLFSRGVENPDPSAAYFISATEAARWFVDPNGRLRPGLRIEDRSSAHVPSTGTWWSRRSLERDGIRIQTHPEHARGLHDAIWRVGQISNLRWRRLGSSVRSLECDALTLVDTAPSWAYFGPHGRDVADLLAAIERITLAAVRAIPADARRAKPPLAVPERLARRRLMNARSHASDAVARRARAVDPSAGAVYDDPIDPLWILTDERWRTVQVWAWSAAEALAEPHAMTDDERAERLSRWAAFVAIIDAAR